MHVISITGSAAVLAVLFAATGVTAQDDREALAALYDATDGPNWHDSTNWKTSEPIQLWFGVLDNTHDDRAEALQLSMNGLSGFLPPELWTLDQLRVLQLFGNSLKGPIPAELGRLTNLEELFLDRNQLSGPIPSELGNLTRLSTTLSLASNQLSGPIPSELGNLTRLTALSLADNQLSGPIRSALGNLTRLTSLSLASNQLSRPIPSELGNLTRLKYLYLADNNLSGPIPAALGQLTNLEYLGLDSDTGLCLPPDFPADSNFAALARGQFVLDCSSDEEPLPCPVNPQSQCQVNAGDTCETCPPDCQKAYDGLDKILEGVPFGYVGLRLFCRTSRILGQGWLCTGDLEREYASALEEYRRTMSSCFKKAATASIGVRGLTGALEEWDVEMESSDPSVLQVVEDSESITLVKHKAGPVALRFTGTNSSEEVVAGVWHHLMIGSTAVPALTGVALALLFVALATGGAVRLRRRRGAS